jgi:hypothetical protein
MRHNVEDGASDKLVCWFDGGDFMPFMHVEATREVDLRGGFCCLMEILVGGASQLAVLMTTCETRSELELCGGCGEAPAHKRGGVQRWMRRGPCALWLLGLGIFIPPGGLS